MLENAADRASTDYASSIRLPESGVPVKNRLVKAAMVEGLCSVLNGQPNDAHFRLYNAWANAGFGMIISGNVCIANDHLGTPGDLRLPESLSEATLAPWRTLATSLSRPSASSSSPATDEESIRPAIAILQLVHTGRQSVRFAGRPPWVPPIAPSAVRVSTSPSSYIARAVEAMIFQMPREMSNRDIEHVQGRFVHGARLAKQAGFHGVQLHASHGYLLSSFLSPKTNLRADQYGGSTAARLKIVLDIITRIRKDCPKPFVLGIKLNAADYLEGGLTETEALEHIAYLTRHGGLDFIEISGGSYESLAFLDADSSAQTQQAHASTPSSRTVRREALFAAFAAHAKSVTQGAARTSEGELAPLIMCTGGFRTRKGIEHALREDGVDLIGLGRPSAADADWITRLLRSFESKEPSSIDCATYTVTGASYIQALVPLKLVGGSMTTLWHQMQMRRLARGQKPRLGWGLERLLGLEILIGILSSWAGLAVLTGCAAAGAWILKQGNTAL